MAFFREATPPRGFFLDVPASVFGLIGIILVAHAVRLLLPGDLPNEILEQFALIPARLVPSAWAALGQPPVSFWDAIVPFAGYQFLHADWFHAGINSLWLLIAGTPVARRMGTVKFLGLFLACGIAAGLAFLAVHWAEETAAIGASGSIAGLMGAAIRIFYGARAFPVPANDRIAPLAPLFSSPVIFFSAIWVVTNVIMGLTGFGTEGRTELIAWDAHIGGYFAGLILIGPFDALSRKRGAGPT